MVENFQKIPKRKGPEGKRIYGTRKWCKYKGDEDFETNEEE